MRTRARRHSSCMTVCARMRRHSRALLLYMHTIRELIVCITHMHTWCAHVCVMTVCARVHVRRPQVEAFTACGYEVLTYVYHLASLREGVRLLSCQPEGGRASTILPA